MSSLRILIHLKIPNPKFSSFDVDKGLLTTVRARGQGKLKIDALGTGITETTPRNRDQANQGPFKQGLRRHVCQGKFKCLIFDAGQITDFKCQGFDL